MFNQVIKVTFFQKVQSSSCPDTETTEARPASKRKLVESIRRPRGSQAQTRGREGKESEVLAMNNILEEWGWNKPETELKTSEEGEKRVRTQPVECSYSRNLPHFF